MRTSRLHPARDVGMNELEEQSFNYATAIVKLSRRLSGEIPAPVAGQLVFSGTAIGAELSEANSLSDKRSQLGNFSAARRASREVQYWLRLIAASEIASEDTIAPLLEEARELNTLLRNLVTRTRVAIDAERGEAP